MKIAIYGDSFGCMNCEDIADDKNHSWPHLLRQLPGVKFLKNYSKVGKSVISTYSDFLKFLLVIYRGCMCHESRK